MPDVLSMEIAVKHGVSCLLGEVQPSSEGFLLLDVSGSGIAGICT